MLKFAQTSQSKAQEERKKKSPPPKEKREISPGDQGEATGSKDTAPLKKSLYDKL